MKRLILVEGLPGTGKSTMSEWICDLLNKNGENATLLPEGDERIPLDFYETAGIPNTQFAALRDRNVQHCDFLDITARRTKNYAFLRIDACPAELAEQLRMWDMGDEGNKAVSVRQYIDCALERLCMWTETVRSMDETLVIDSGYLQNPLNELLFRNASDEQAIGFVEAIAARLMPLNPMCVYLRRESADEAIRFAKAVKGEQWAQRVDALLEQSGQHNLFGRRFELEQALLHVTPHIVCEVAGDDWSSAKEQLTSLL